jgi:hypothetical protein
MQRNRYRANELATVDLEKQDVHFYFSIMNLTNGMNVRWDEFWPNFSLWASIIVSLPGGAFEWEPIEIVKCESLSWWAKSDD